MPVYEKPPARPVDVYSSGDASDSICPKGWGMAKYDADGSYHKLIANIYGMNKTNNWLTQNYKENSINITVNDILVKFPITIVKSSYYSPDNGRFSNRGFGLNFWVSRTQALLYSTDLSLHTKAGGYKEFGNSIRCVVKSF